MIVETHSHINVELEGVEDASYFNYGTKILGVDDYLRHYDANGVDACWVFGHRGWRNDALIQAENDALARLARDYPKRLFPWAIISPQWPETRICEEVERVAGPLALHGLKLVPIIQGFAISSAGMDVVAREAMRWGLPVFFHDGSPEYCSAIQVAYFARKYPELRVVSGHGGLRELWPDLIPAVQELRNLWICLSGPTQWGIQTLYDELGPDKLMFGSDGGIGPAAIIQAYLRRIERLRAPREHKAMILGGNAMRFLSGGH